MSVVLEPTYGGVTHNKIPFIVNQNGSLHYVKGMSSIKHNSNNSERLMKRLWWNNFTVRLWYHSNIHARFLTAIFYKVNYNKFNILMYKTTHKPNIKNRIYQDSIDSNLFLMFAYLWMEYKTELYKWMSDYYFKHMIKWIYALLWESKISKFLTTFF